MRIQVGLAILVALPELQGCCFTPAQEPIDDAGSGDGGGLADAGPTIDAGAPYDAGLPVDAGGLFDGGTLDAGPTPDGGTADCTIGGVGYATGDLNPQNDCQSCQPGVLTSNWTNLNPGTPCGNGFVCDPNGTCGPPPPGCQVGTVQVPDRASNPSDLSLCCNHRRNPYAWTPRLAPGASFAVPENGGSLTVADFDHDGFSDLAVVSSTRNDPALVTVFLNPQGILNGAVSYPLNSAIGSYASDLLSLDLNQDGFPDLVAADSTVVSGGLSPGISVLINNGDGTFSAPIDYGGAQGFGEIQSGDLNGDGIPDVVFAGNSVFDWLAIGDGGLLPAVSVGSGNATHGQATVGDFNRDGLMDVAIGNFYQAPVVLFFSGHDSLGNYTLTQGASYGTYVGLSDSVGQMLTMDIDGDGVEDLVMAFYSAASGLVVLLGRGDGTFGPWTVYPFRWLAAAAAADLEGNGIQRLLFSTDSTATGYPVSQVQQFAINPDGGLSANVILSPDGGFFNQFRIGDFNGDGAQDLASIDGTIYLNGCP